ncbi:hypothetical protein K8352_04610 [Flavobacteriaceae bacterium F89]|uniref:Lipoprotein n=1 Tax=Cerina litoralis TaxID=2874477 RepID=A0AAE3EUJ8_9FLAO|nr:hypothetical protein [Cerina litoralis]MCG2460016.1 hypothetical protein [Cerina litoralis]
MRKTVIAIAVLSLAIGCKEGQKKKSHETETNVEIVDRGSHAGVNQVPDDTWVDEIVLDNGVKWNANKETTDGVAKMLSLIGDSKATTSEAYRELGGSLNEVKNNVVKECTMEGASHDNLHVWLHPLIEKIGLLQKTETGEEGAKLTANIKNHLEGYFDYFN